MTEWDDLYSRRNMSLSEAVLSFVQRKAYELAKEFCIDKKVLEIGAGSGYGALQLSKVAERLVALDIDKKAVRYACENYFPKQSKSLVIGNGKHLPFIENSFDTIVLFQVIEHIRHKEVHAFLFEIKRVLRCNGIMLLTTPNRKIRLLPFQKPWNPNHQIEYSPRNLEKTLEKVFRSVNVFGLRATSSVEKIEKTRVKQKPYDVYLKGKLEFLHRCPKKGLSRFISEKNRHPFSETPIDREMSIEDFYYTPQSLNQALDLLAIVSKC
jgi:ubiquinone/menaquinone biosynthesis C-methylase UbiE